MAGNSSRHGKPRRTQAQIGTSHGMFPSRGPGRALEVAGNSHRRGMVIAAFGQYRTRLIGFLTYLLIILPWLSGIKKTVQRRVLLNSFLFYRANLIFGSLTPLLSELAFWRVIKPKPVSERMSMLFASR